MKDGNFTYSLDEIFLTIQGESSDSGLPCIFVRFYGCPIGCSFCDQPQNPNLKQNITINDLMARVRKFKPIKYVCITGGEPLMQKYLPQFVMELLSEGYKVGIETSGCYPLMDFPYRRSFKYVMDIKCPCSGVSHKNIYENLLKLQFNDEVKFVIKDRRDYEFMLDVLKKYPTSASILLSPMFTPKNEMTIGADLVKWMLEDNLQARVQLQIHKILKVK